MKENVDLTLNRDFRKRSNTLSNRLGLSLIPIDNSYMFPWNDVYTVIREGDLDVKSQEVELVYTGDKGLRMHKKFWDEENGERWLECDRCGAYTKEYHWDMHDSTRCKSCDEWLESNGERVPWRGRVGRF